MDDPLSVYMSEQLIQDYFEKLKFHNARKIVCVCVKFHFITNAKFAFLHLTSIAFAGKYAKKYSMPCFLVFLKQTQNLFTLHSLKSLFVVNFPESEMNVILT